MVRDAVGAWVGWVGWAEPGIWEFSALGDGDFFIFADVFGGRGHHLAPRTECAGYPLPAVIDRRYILGGASRGRAGP
jgi:hypothetical protein